MSRAAILCLSLALVSCAPKSSITQPSAARQSAETLPSWNDGSSKQAITAFIRRVTTEKTPDFIAPEDRIATFDNDGTLWSEQPMYFQFIFVMDRVKELAPEHPEWKTKQPFRGVIEGDMKAVLGSGEKGLAEMLAVASTGITADQSDSIVQSWIATARHPKTKRLYTEMVFQPMIELLQYLRANGFKTFIVSGGGIDFMRPWTNRVYGIPPEQVVGTVLKAEYGSKEGPPVLNLLPGIAFVDDGPGKPVGIRQFIGRRPVFAAGNSDGDREMLEYTTNGGGPRFGMIIHHTDAEREWAYDRESHIGKLDKALDQARTANWTVVDMKQDWKTIYPPVKAQ
ncbi:MAG: haloacid dehalogenase-like hydrolase [Acidobacteria bacterium]|nr:haloacid dehalogenase-like hydrolase [Acidobacteriota bacterium]